MTKIPSKAITLRRMQPHILVCGLVLTLALLVMQAVTVTARDVPESFADLAEKLSPTVVNITAKAKVVRAGNHNRPMFPKGSPFEDLFKEFFDSIPQFDNQRLDPALRKRGVLGSGFIISDDGLIVTNNHVIDNADEVMVEFLDGTEVEAKLIGRDHNTDIALLKVDIDTPEFVEFGDSDAARVGDWVMAIGNPLGQGFSVSAGIISARNRILNAGPYDDFIQTDAAINRGNSGGPLFNMDGDVIGVNTIIISPTGGSVGLGFAMSSRVVNQVVTQLIEYGETRRGWLGVELQSLDSTVADALGLPDVKGALIKAVPDGPSKEAGIKAGDVILRFDGQEIENNRNLVNVVGNTTAGKKVSVVVFRDGAEKILNVTLGRREDAERAANNTSTLDPAKPKKDETLGVTLGVITDDLRSSIGLDKDVSGVVILGVNEASDAFEKGLRKGDVISKVNQQSVSTLDDVTALLDDARNAGRSAILLTVVRGKDQRFVGLSLE